MDDARAGAPAPAASAKAPERSRACRPRGHRRSRWRARAASAGEVGVLTRRLSFMAATCVDDAQSAEARIAISQYSKPYAHVFAQGAGWELEDVERSVAWLSRNRRLAKDYERHVQTSGALIEVAASCLALRRLASPASTGNRSRSINSVSSVSPHGSPLLLGQSQLYGANDAGGLRASPWF